MEINHTRWSPLEEERISKAAEDVYDVLIEKACQTGAGMAYRRLAGAAVDASNPSDEAIEYISSIQMEVAKRMIAHMLMRSTEI